MYTYIWYLVYGHPQRSESNMLSIDDLGLMKARSRTTQRSRAKHGRDIMENANQVPGIVTNIDPKEVVAKSDETDSSKNEINELLDMVKDLEQQQEPLTPSEKLPKYSPVIGTPVEDLKVYCQEQPGEEISWKKFLPPLPRYTKCAEGWFYVTDAIMIMPLSIFCSLIMLSLKIPNLHEYLNDPIKKHIPLMFLPEVLQQQLCYRRKYIHSFHMGLQRSCQMGLLTFGPAQNFFDKDQVFCYLHQKGTIVDTTSCKKHYNQVNLDTYPTEHYMLNSVSSVDQFFRDLQVICLNTPLGLSRRNRTEELRKTSAEERMMIKELQVVVKDISIPPEDTGKLPGNSRGAAGLDSRMYTHLRKNWSLPAPPGQTTAKEYKSRHRRRIDMLRSIKNRHRAHGKKLSLKAVNVVGETQKGRQEKNKGGRGLKRPKPLSDTLPKKKPAKRVRITEKPLPSVGPRTKMILKRQRYEWNEEEDNMLLMFQIATLLLTKKRTGFFVSWSHRRDVLHKRFPNSTDKTTTGMMRRSSYLIKSPAFRLRLATNYGKVQNDEVLNEAMKTEVNSNSNEACEKEYTDVVELIIQRLRLNSMNDQQLPWTLKEFHEQYKTFRTPEMLNLLPRYKIPQQVQWKTTDLEEIKKLVVRQAVMASFFLIDRPVLFNPSQAFYVFNQFQEKFLMGVVGALKEAYLTTRNRFRRRIRRVLPCAAMSLQVSRTCRRTFNSTISSDVIKESYEYMQELDKHQYDSNSSINVPINATCGQVACFLSMLCCDLVDYEIEVPNQVILLDSSFINKAALERTAKLMGNAEEYSDESDEEADSQKAKTREQKRTSSQRSGTVVEPDKLYPMYKRMTRIQKISHAIEEKGIDQRMAAETPEPDIEITEHNQVAAQFVNTEHSYTQMMPTIVENSAPSESVATTAKNSTLPEKEIRKMKQQEFRVCSTRTDWFLLQGLGDEGMSEEGGGMLDAIMLKPCKIDIKLRKPLKESIHRFVGKTSLSSDDHLQILHSLENGNLYSLRNDFMSFIDQGDQDCKTQWTCLEHFERTKFIPIPLMKKTLMEDITGTLSEAESKLFRLISDKHHRGLMVSELIAVDAHLDVHAIIECLHMLMKKQLIFRVGLDIHRYVAVHYCDLWSIASVHQSPVDSASAVRPKITRKTDDAERKIIEEEEEVTANSFVCTVEKTDKKTDCSEGIIIEEEKIVIEEKEEVIADNPICFVENVDMDHIELASTNISDEFQKEKVTDNIEEVIVHVDEEVLIMATEEIKHEESIFPVQNVEIVDVITSTNIIDQLQNEESEQANIIIQDSTPKFCLSSNENSAQLNNTSDLENHSSRLETSEDNLENTNGVSTSTVPNGNDTVLNTLSTSSPSKQVVNDSETAPTRSARIAKKRNADYDRIIFSDLNLTKETEVQFIPRQWFNLGGEVDVDELVRLLQKLGLIVVSKPGIPEKNIIRQLHLVLSPVECKEILQMLQQAGCITKHVIPKLPSSHPFGDSTNKTLSDYYYNPTSDCMLRLAVYESYKTSDEILAGDQDENQSQN